VQPVGHALGGRIDLQLLRQLGVLRVPATAAYIPLPGEVRLPSNPRSTRYNTDGQIFSDAGIPVVLVMENYDINREGYLDTHDTMANIDLDYGSALAAIAIEAVTRAATQEPPAGPARPFPLIGPDVVGR
jgi:hypothetical protein